MHMHPSQPCSDTAAAGVHTLRPVAINTSPQDHPQHVGVLAREHTLHLSWLRGTSLIRKRPPPLDPPGSLGMGLR